MVGYCVIVGGGDDIVVVVVIFMFMFDLFVLMQFMDVLCNVMVNLCDGLDMYVILFVRLLQQSVGVIVMWNMLSGNVISDDVVMQVVQFVVLVYINGIQGGGYINENVLCKCVIDVMFMVFFEEDIMWLVFGYIIDGVVVVLFVGE